MMLRRRYLEPVYEDDDFIEKVLRTLGEQYEIVGDGLGKGDKLAKTFGEMRLVVCARRDILPHISGAQIATKATGIGGFYTNKGGIAAKFDYRGTSLCFVGSHLAAHEGIKYCRKRNADAAQIQRGARVGNKEVSFDSQFDHVFWGGDLNYRQENPSWWSDPALYASGAKADSIDHQGKLYMVKQAVAAKDWQTLEANDELRREMALGNVYSGWSDALQFERDISEHGFLPTFKMQRGRRYDFFSQRVPSFTDRVLWKSAPGSGELPCPAAPPTQNAPLHWHTANAFSPQQNACSPPRAVAAVVFGVHRPLPAAAVVRGVAVPDHLRSQARGGALRAECPAQRARAHRRVRQPRLSIRRLADPQRPADGPMHDKRRSSD
jgi:hypothetical protein